MGHDSTVQCAVLLSWRFGVVVDSSSSPSDLRQSVDFGSGAVHLVVVQSTDNKVCLYPRYPRSTQPCIPPGSLNRVPALAGVEAGM